MRKCYVLTINDIIRLTECLKSPSQNGRDTHLVACAVQFKLKVFHEKSVQKYEHMFSSIQQL